MSEGNVIINIIQSGNIKPKPSDTLVTIDSDVIMENVSTIMSTTNTNYTSSIYRKDSTCKQWIPDNVQTKLQFNVDNVYNSVDSFGSWDESTNKFTFTKSEWYDIDVAYTLGNEFQNKHLLQIYNPYGFDVTEETLQTTTRIGPPNSYSVSSNFYQTFVITSEITLGEIHWAGLASQSFPITAELRSGALTASGPGVLPILASFPFSATPINGDYIVDFSDENLILSPGSYTFGFPSGTTILWQITTTTNPSYPSYAGFFSTDRTFYLDVYNVGSEFELARAIEGQSQVISTGLGSFIQTSAKLYLEIGDTIDFRTIQTSGDPIQVEKAYFCIHPTGLSEQSSLKAVETADTFCATGNVRTDMIIAKTDPLNGLITIIDKMDLNNSNIWNVKSVTFDATTNIKLDNTAAAGVSTGTDSIAIGRGASADQTRTIAMGHNADAGATNCISFGYNSECNGTETVVIGKSGRFQLQDSVVIGPDSGSYTIPTEGGSRVVVIGSAAGNSVKTRYDQVIIGYDAGDRVGQDNGAGSIGSRNICIGSHADGRGWNRDMVIIGYSAYAGYNGGRSSATVLGYQTFSRSDNTCMLGSGCSVLLSSDNACVLQKRVLGTSNWAAWNTATAGPSELGHSTSSGRFKKDIRPLEDVGDLIDQIRLVRFEPEFEDCGMNCKKEYIGIIAEELESIFPEFIGYEEDGVTPGSVSYPELVSVALREIQSIRQRVTALESA